MLVFLQPYPGALFIQQKDRGLIVIIFNIRYKNSTMLTNKIKISDITTLIDIYYIHMTTECLMVCVGVWGSAQSICT